AASVCRASSATGRHRTSSTGSLPDRVDEVDAVRAAGVDGRCEFAARAGIYSTPPGRAAAGALWLPRYRSRRPHRRAHDAFQSPSQEAPTTRHTMSSGSELMRMGRLLQPTPRLTNRV